MPPHGELAECVDVLLILPCDLDLLNLHAAVRVNVTALHAHRDKQRSGLSGL